MSYDLMNLTVKSLCPTNEVLLDDRGMPSVMVKIPKFLISDVIEGGSNSVHPAFIVNGEEKDYIYISKYQNIINNGRAYSLPFEDPKASIDFDTAKAACEAKGNGWHLMTNAEFAALALWCRKHECMPRGNTNYGKSSDDATEQGIVSYTYQESGQTKNGRTFTGTGPLSWYHDGTPGGIADLCGNVWEWVGGLRLNNGEIQIIPDNNAAVTGTNMGAQSSLWKAISKTGSLVAPGTAETLKYDYITTPAQGGKIQITDTLVNQQENDDVYAYQTFESLTAKSGITVPEIMKTLALAPADAESHGGDYIYMRNNGERLPLRGGSWRNSSEAGVFALNLDNLRSYANHNRGFRSAFVEL